MQLVAELFPLAVGTELALRWCQLRTRVVAERVMPGCIYSFCNTNCPFILVAIATEER